ncbi:alcohol oxidase [Guyanagaster necrorhizus]|uniref:Alcohol oxidase n=1 Tax=Guyanagaster necrorhizus TaxID=856835 RepID=A0A9P7W043_9AGAR|nr:alcohol oxidase [Guyanagaster necrorhizus MCA 3950]KAG7449768.1 alcohol oxidase [Guyanagaster necrorhizus MCA 3950]
MPIVTVVDFFTTKFDYLVVGGGTAGLVVAARLSENPDCIVGVVEAGEYHEHDDLVNIPGMMARALHDPKYDWNFHTVPQKFVNNRQLSQSRGKGLGGSSLLNFFASVRPSKEEIDAIESLGNPGWNWENMLHYMKKSEHLETPTLTDEEATAYSVVPDTALHGTEGPIAKSFPPHVTKVHTQLLDTLESLGIPRNLDNSNGHPVGSLLFPTSVEAKTATRSYSASAYYAPNADRSNLLILTNAHATKVNLTKTESGRYQATSVTLVKDGLTKSVHASKEIILSAGSFQTPQLLELSGIGQERLLQSFGIECLIDLPGVGENLQDHALTHVIVEVDEDVETLEVLSDPAKLKEHEELYKIQKGIFAGVPSATFAFFPAESIATTNEVETWISRANLESARNTLDYLDSSVREGMKKQFGLLANWIRDATQPMAQILSLNGHMPIPGMNIDRQKRYLTLLCAYTHPFHRGSVHIMSVDPLMPPAIEQNYLSNPNDLDVLVKILAFVTNKLCQTSPIKDTIKSTVVPPFSAEAGDETMGEYIRNTLTTVHHPAGTASMVPRSNGGVVDSNLLVYGTSNLRVVDCSVIPLQLSSNIQTLAYAIGEKAADIIKGQ